MIALLSPDGEGSPELRLQLQTLEGPVTTTATEQPSSIIDAAIIARRTLRHEGAGPLAVAAASLASARALNACGIVGGPWLAFPAGALTALATSAGGLAGDGVDGLVPMLQALAREARASERGLAAARHRAAADEQRLRDALGRASYSALSVFGRLQQSLVIGIPEVAQALDLTPPTVSAAVVRMETMGIAREVTGRQRARRFVYTALVDALAP